MKKQLIISFLLLSLLLLVGCTRVLERSEYPLTSPVQTRCVFSGSVTDSVADGTFWADGGWSYTGTAQDGALVAGEICDYPCLIEINGIPLMGFYSGAVANGLPHGDGQFISGESEFSGSFDFGQADTGTVSALPFMLSSQEEAFTGTYTGSVKGGLLSGEGAFTGCAADGSALSVSGQWADGAPAGDGVLSVDRFEAVLCGETYCGHYEGACRDGLPSGQGVFTARTGDDVSLTYEGEWNHGLANGSGTLRFGSPLYYDRCGQFTDGLFTPTFSELLNSLGSCEPTFSLSEAQTDFINEYGDLWNGTHDLLCFDDSELKTVFDKTLTIRKCLQSPEAVEEPGWMSVYSLRVVTADRVSLSENGPEFTCITAYDNAYSTLVRLLVPQGLEGLARARRIHTYAIPLSFSSYTTVNGETKDCLVMLAGDLVIAF